MAGKYIGSLDLMPLFTVVRYKHYMMLEVSILVVLNKNFFSGFGYDAGNASKYLHGK